MMSGLLDVRTSPLAVSTKRPSSSTSSSAVPQITGADVTNASVSSLNEKLKTAIYNAKTGGMTSSEKTALSNLVAKAKGFREFYGGRRPTQVAAAHWSVMIDNIVSGEAIIGQPVSPDRDAGININLVGYAVQMPPPAASTNTPAPQFTLGTLLLNQEDVRAAVDTALTETGPLQVDCGATAYWSPDAGACLPLETDDSVGTGFFSQYKYYLIGAGAFAGVGALAWYLLRKKPTRTRNKEEDPNWVEAYQRLEQAKDYLITRRDVGHAKLRVLEAMHHARQLPMGSGSQRVLEQDINTVIKQIDKVEKKGR